jgi:hypothetical protein
MRRSSPFSVKSHKANSDRRIRNTGFIRRTRWRFVAAIFLRRMTCVTVSLSCATNPRATHAGEIRGLAPGRPSSADPGSSTQPTPHHQRARHPLRKRRRLRLETGRERLENRPA